jgi:hypothetical protein
MFPGIVNERFQPCAPFRGYANRIKRIDDVLAAPTCLTLTAPHYRPFLLWIGYFRVLFL